MPYELILLVFALVLGLCAGFNVPSRVQLGWLGFSCYILYMILTAGIA